MEQAARLERKFVAYDASYAEVEQSVKLLPLCCREIYARRVVNNIYLDTPNWDRYDESVAGVSERFKPRIRWYGDADVRAVKAALELKRKRGHCVLKGVVALGTIDLPRPVRRQHITEWFSNAELGANVIQTVEPYQPTLHNRYERTYFLSACRGIRITIDTRLAFGSMEAIGRPWNTLEQLSRETIIEFKYPPQLEPQAEAAMAVFPWRMTRFSKYVTGVDSAGQESA